MFRVLGTPLRWSPLFAFSALAVVGSRSGKVRTQTRTEPRGAQKLSTGASKGRTRAMHNGGGCGLESALMHSPLLEVVTAQKPQTVASGLGLRSLWSTDSVGESYTGYCRIGKQPLFCARSVTADKHRLS